MRSRLALAAFALVFVALPLAAQSNDVGIWLAGDRVKNTSFDASSEIRFTHGHGYGLSINHYWCSRFSTELMGTSLRHNSALFLNGDRAFGTGRLELTAISLTGQLHLNRDMMFDPYLSGGVAHITAKDLKSSDLDSAGIGNVRIDSKTSWTAGVGANFNVMKSLTVAVDARYMHYRPSSGTSASDQVELNLDPVVVSAGVKF
ncbi:MAG: OmpW family outer membrane protein, partial [Acidobacteriota bacterium]